MGSTKTSPIWTPTKEEFQNIVNSCNTNVEILKYFGLSPYSGNHRTLKKRIIEDEIDLTTLNKNRKIFLSNCIKNALSGTKTTHDKIFCENSKYVNNKQIKREFLNYKEYKCDRCENLGVWNNENLTLQLDHINGVNTDNRVENLRFLCPNCHSQTKTFSGKHRKKKYYCDCGNQKTKESNSCISCGLLRQRKVKDRPSKDQLLEDVKNLNYRETGKKYGVSDNTIRKWLK